MYRGVIRLLPEESFTSICLSVGPFAIRGEEVEDDRDCDPSLECLWSFDVSCM